MGVEHRDWRLLGACRGLEAEIFFPETEQEAANAKAVCEGCGVLAACLHYALSAREASGVWGGATELDRRRIIRRRRKSA